MISPVIPRIVKKEFLQAFRDRRMVVIILIAPVIQTILFGFAVNLDLSAQPAVIADMDKSTASRAAARAIAESESFTVTEYADTHSEAERRVALGKAALAILLPRGFEESVARGDAELLVVLDGSDSNTALRAGQEVSQLLNQQALERQRARLEQVAEGLAQSIDTFAPQVRIEARAWFNPQLKTAVFLVPAVLALVLTVITMLLTSMGLTREKEIGTLEQVMVTPVRPIELMVGKTLPFAILGLLDVAVIVAAATMIFDLPVRGSLPALFAASGLFLMTTLGLGLFISTVSATQQQAMMNSFFFVLPALMLSGYIFPIENMPAAVQVLTLVNPLRYYVELTRGILVKGATLAELWQSTLALGLLGSAVLLGAAWRFRKRAL